MKQIPFLNLKVGGEIHETVRSQLSWVLPENTRHRVLGEVRGPLYDLRIQLSPLRLEFWYQ